MRSKYNEGGREKADEANAPPSLDPPPPTGIAMRDLLNSKQKSRENGKRMINEGEMNIVSDKLAGATT